MAGQSKKKPVKQGPKLNTIDVMRIEKNKIYIEDEKLDS